MSWRNRNNKNKNMNLIEMFNKQILLDKTPLWKDHLIPFYPIDKNYFKINNNKYDIDSLKNDVRLNGARDYYGYSSDDWEEDYNNYMADKMDL